MDWGERDEVWAGIRGAVLRVRGHAIHALRLDGRDGGPVQVLVHGLGSSSHNWLDAMPRLAEFGDVVAVDLPGYGQSAIPPGGSARVRANAGFLVALLDELAPSPAILYGSSMGGLLTTLAAARRPPNLVGLVLVNPALPAPRRSMLRQPKRVFSRILPAALPGIGRIVIEYGLRRSNPEELVEESLQAALGPQGRVRPVLREALVDNLRDIHEHAWRRRAIADAARSLVALHVEGTEVADAVDAIDAPTLLLWGDADNLVPAHTIGALVERRPDWEQHVFGGVGHAPMLEVPDLFADVVANWQETALR